MATTDVARSTNLQTPRVVKCPTPQCPGWITLDSTRHQTEPCRYCRIGVDTLRFLLSRVGAENKALSTQVHDEFNRLMLTMAGAWGQNVYLRASHDTLVDLKAGARGVIIEYNPMLGDARAPSGRDGPAPLVGIILHKLLHFEAHLGHHARRAPAQITAKSGAREREGLIPLLSYLMTATDHAWVSARLQQLNPLLHSAQSHWGLDLAQMLVGSESMFNRYLSERNLNRLVAVLQGTKDAEAFRDAVIARLADLTKQTLEREKDEVRRIYLAIQLANVRLLNPDAYSAYGEALTSREVANVREAIALADRLYADLSNTPVAKPPAQADEGDTSHAVTLDAAHFNRAVEGSLKVLGVANYFEVKS